MENGRTGIHIFNFQVRYLAMYRYKFYIWGPDRSLRSSQTPLTLDINISVFEKEFCKLGAKS